MHYFVCIISSQNVADLCAVGWWVQNGSFSVTCFLVTSERTPSVDHFFIQPHYFRVGRDTKATRFLVVADFSNRFF